MPRTREEKGEIIEDLTDKFSRSRAVVLTDYRGLGVPEITELRNRMREKGAGFHVVKNTLTQLALEKLESPIPDGLKEGPTAIGFCYEEVATPIKALKEFNEEFGKPLIKGGVLGDQLLSDEQISALAELPSREVLLGQVVSGIQAPVRGLVNVLSGPTRDLVYVLQARRSQLEEEA